MIFIKKYIISCVLFLCFSFLSVAQTPTFTLQIDTNLYNLPLGVVEMKDSYVAVYVRYPYNTNFTTNVLLKINKNGEIITTKEYGISISKIIETSDSTFIGIGVDKTNQTNKFHLVEFDQQFNILWEKDYNTTDNILGIKTVITNYKGNIVCLGSLFNADTQLPVDLFLFEATINGDSIRYQSYNGVTDAWLYTLFEDADSSGYNIILNGTFGEPPVIAYYRVETDAFFNIDTVIDIRNDGIFSCTNPIWLNDSVYVLPGRGMHFIGFEGQEEAKLMIKNKTHGTIAENFVLTPDTFDYIADIHSIVTDSESNIYFLQIAGIDFYHYPFQTTPSQILFSKFDKNLNLKWTKRYGGDAFYFVRDLFATQDNGFIILCTKYDYNLNNNADIYMLKLDKDGLLSDIIVPHTDKSNDIQVFPNPCQNTVKVTLKNTSDKSMFKLIDVSGKTLIEQNLYNDITDIDITSLPVGVYFYYLVQNNCFKFGGKIIKN